MNMRGWRKCCYTWMHPETTAMQGNIHSLKAHWNKKQISQCKSHWSCSRVVLGKAQVIYSSHDVSYWEWEARMELWNSQDSQGIKSPQGQILTCCKTALPYEIHYCIKTKALGFHISSQDLHMPVFWCLNLYSWEKTQFTLEYHTEFFAHLGVWDAIFFPMGGYFGDLMFFLLRKKNSLNARFF